MSPGAIIPPDLVTKFMIEHTRSQTISVMGATVWLSCDTLLKRYVALKINSASSDIHEAKFLKDLSTTLPISQVLSMGRETCIKRGELNVHLYDHMTSASTRRPEKSFSIHMVLGDSVE